MSDNSKKKYGWQNNGEYHCPCGMIFGKNLKNESPTHLVAGHVATCVPYAIQRLKNGLPLAPVPPQITANTWDKAIVAYFRNIGLERKG